MEVHSKACNCFISMFVVTLVVTHSVTSTIDEFTDYDSQINAGQFDSSDGSLAQDGTASGERGPHHHCCVRETKLKHIGTSVTGEVIQMDIGHCKKRCSAKKPLKRKRFQKLLKENPEADPRELFLRYSTRLHPEPSCPERQICSEAESRLEKVLTAQGEMSVRIVESCSCQNHPKVCKRLPKMLVLHKGTPLETFVDIGECSGHCGQDTSCKPMVSKTTSVQGPNGAECVGVIEDCACATQCYRASHYEQHYHYVNGSPTVKIVDVGRCAGECDNSAEDRCVLREESGGECLMSLSGSKTECRSLAVNDISVTDKHGSKKNITSIAYCGCQS